MISVNTLKQYLNIDGTGSDDFLRVCIETSLGNIENYCNRKFTAGDYVDYISGDASDEVFIKNYPLSEISTIEVLGYDNWENLFNDDDLTVTYLFVIPEINKVKLTNGYTFPIGSNNIKISYTSGWSEDEAEKDIEGILLEMAATFYNNSPVSGQARLGKSSENMNSTASTSATYKSLKPEWKSVLKKYRISNY